MSVQVHYYAGGEQLDAEVFADPRRTDRRPGVLVFHDGGGRGVHTRERAGRLAAMGFVALVPDMFGVPVENRMHGTSMSRELVAMPARLRLRANAALAMLKSLESVDSGRTAAIGYCFGGTVALELARSGADLGCVVSFHGGLNTTMAAEADVVRAAVLALSGARDPFVNLDQRTWFQAEMSKARVDWQLVVYADAKHSFTNPHLDPELHPGSQYDPRADRRSWRAMLDLFDETFAPG